MLMIILTRDKNCAAHPFAHCAAPLETQRTPEITAKTKLGDKWKDGTVYGPGEGRKLEVWEYRGGEERGGATQERKGKDRKRYNGRGRKEGRSTTEEGRGETDNERKGKRGKLKKTGRKGGM